MSHLIDLKYPLFHVRGSFSSSSKPMCQMPPLKLGGKKKKKKRKDLRVEEREERKKKKKRGRKRRKIVPIQSGTAHEELKIQRKVLQL